MSNVDDITKIKTYEEFKEEHKDLGAPGNNCKCFYCDKTAEYISGDARFYYPSCEEHAEMKERYNFYKERAIARIQAREKWTKLPWVKEALDELEKDILEGTSDIEPKGLFKEGRIYE